METQRDRRLERRVNRQIKFALIIGSMRARRKGDVETLRLCQAGIREPDIRAEAIDRLYLSDGTFAGRMDTVQELGDGTFLKLLMEYLPQILEMIKLILDMFTESDV